MATAIQKTFKCIEALSRSPAGMTVSEVAATAGFSRPAATRLLEALTADSILVRDPRSKRYRLGLQLYEWANAAIQASTPINIARKEFIKLSMDTGRECSLLVLEGLDAVILERCQEIDGVPLNRPVPGRRAWHLTASGKAIVAFLQPAAMRSVVERTLMQPDAKSLREDGLMAELEQVRQRGFAESRDMRPQGMVSLGVPVLGQAGHAIAAIGTYMPASDLEQDVGANLIAQMRATAARVSHYVGYEAQFSEVIS